MSGLVSGLVGIQTKAAQPAFFVRVSADVANVTGDNTNYTIIFDTEVFDQNGDFDGTSTFTAPVTGRYQLSFLCGIQSLLSVHTAGFYHLETSNRAVSQYINPYAVFGGGVSSFNESLLVDMDANDTAICKLKIQRTSGSGDTLDLFGGVGATLFTGQLVV
jgi:hypothetical protein